MYWVICSIGSIFGGIFFIYGFATATNGYLQEATAAAVGMAFSVIPYCFARSQSEYMALKASKAPEEDVTIESS